MVKTWFEELDEYTVRLTKSYNIYYNVKESSLNKFRKQMDRAEHFDEILKDLLEELDSPYIYDVFLQRALPELRLAMRQFSAFDYKLIALCHGNVLHKWHLNEQFADLNMKRFLMRDIRQHLDKYLRTNNLQHVSRLFSSIHKLTEVSGSDESDIIEALIEVIWLEGLLEGKALE